MAVVIGQARAAVTTEDQVVVLANSNSATSQNIANFYKLLHPNVRIALINAPTTEEITIAQYGDLLGQVQTYLSSNNIIESTNYLVTTKGMPLKIAGANEFNMNTSTFSSVDSELTLAGLDYVRAQHAQAGYSNTAGPLLNPYAKVSSDTAFVEPFPTTYSPFQTFADFKAAQASGTQNKAFYLTARLDAFTELDVYAMLGRAQHPAQRLTGISVIDDDPTINYDQFEALAGYNRGAKEQMQALGAPVLFDNTAAWLTTTAGSVSAYMSHGSHAGMPQDYIKTLLSFSYADGAVFHSYESFNANSFVAGNYRGGQGLIGDFIAQGGTVAAGQVYEPFTLTIAHEEYFLDALQHGYTFADAMWMATEFASFQNVFIGDPLMVWPAPEPTTLWLMALGALASVRAGWLHRRRGRQGRA